jgi:anti-anti-sigma factor
MEPIIIENIYESLPVGLLVVDPQGEIILANPAAAKILGHPGELIRGRGWADLFLEAEENILFNQVFLDVILEEKLNLQRTVPYLRPNGEMLQLAITTSFIRSDQKLVGIVMLVDDVTEIHQLHLHEMTILEEKHRLQRERTESLHKLAMAIAHQLRNPTTAIGGFAAILLKKMGPDTSAGKYLENILSCTSRLEALVRSVHDYTTLPPLSPRRIVAEQLCEKLQQHVMGKAEELCREVSLTIGAENIDLEVDPKLFVQALNEIADNAVEALPHVEGKIEVHVSQKGGTLFIEIRDNGVGISEEDLPYVFDPFFTTKAVGVGMGLCRAKRIIAEHNGNLRIESAPGRGTKVQIQTPQSVSSSFITKGERIMEIAIAEEIINEVTVLKLKGRLDATSAGDLKDRVKALTKAGQVSLVIDMADVDFVDSTGLGSLVGCLRSVNQLAGDMRIAALQDRVRAVFELIRLHHIFQIFDNANAAANSFQPTAKDASK